MYATKIEKEELIVVMPTDIKIITSEEYWRMRGNQN